MGLSLPLPQKTRRVQTVQVQTQALFIAMPALQLETVIHIKLILHPQKLQDGKKEIPQRGPLLQKRRVLVIALGYHCHQLLQTSLQHRRTCFHAMEFRRFPILFLQLKQHSIAGVQGTADRAITLPARCHQIPFAYSGAVHTTRPPGQIVCFIKQNRPAFTSSLHIPADPCKKTVHMVDITYAHIHPGQQVTGQLIGTPFKATRRVFNRLTTQLPVL